MTKKILDINILNKDFQDGKNIFIFGADVVGKVVMKILEENQIFIKGFLDNNKNKCYEKISNLPVEHAPKKLLGIEPAKNLAKLANKNKIKTFNCFLNKKNKNLQESGGERKVMETGKYGFHTR